MNNSTRKSPTTLGRSLRSLIRSLGIEKKVKQNEVLVRWPDIVGQSVSEVTTADKVHDGILFIRVCNSAWRNELIYMKTEIIEKITTTVGIDVIRDIRFI